MADYKINDLYQGGYSSFDSEKGNNFTGYKIPAGDFGMTTDIRTANVLQDFSSKLQMGVKAIEVSGVSPEIFESMPKQQLKDVNRLAKLTGVEPTFHGPVIEPSGFTQQGYNELAREEAERQMISAIERSHDLNPKGNIPVTFHSSASLPSIEYNKEGKVEEKGKIPIINQETGQVNVVKAEEKYYPGMTEEELKKGVKYSAEEQIRIMNDTDWDNSLTELIAIKDRADRMISETAPLVEPLLDKVNSGKINPDYLGSTQKEAFNKFSNGVSELSEIRKHLNSLFSKAWKYSPEQRKVLEQISNRFANKLSKNPNPKGQSEALQDLMVNLKGVQPELYKSVEGFALDKTAQSFANVAFASYNKFKDSAPIISVENPPAGTSGFSRAEDLKNVVNASRAKFVEKAVSEGMSEKQAKKQAEKLIGVTWDVGHINMLRKYGFSEKDIIKESEKVAPILKHVHLSDNFGYEHTELPMGMGNVPMKEIMKKLGEKGFEAKKIIEAGNWWQHFKSPPFKETLEAFGSPIYGMKMAPYWNQSSGFEQGYFSGYGQMLPQTNYETFGAGFSQLPMELGGNKQGGRGSRLSGKPME